MLNPKWIVLGILFLAAFLAISMVTTNSANVTRSAIQGGEPVPAPDIIRHNLLQCASCVGPTCGCGCFALIPAAGQPGGVTTVPGTCSSSSEGTCGGCVPN